MPAIVDEVKKALSQDMAVVIGLQTTGEVCSLYILVHTSTTFVIYVRCFLIMCTSVTLSQIANL